MNDVTVLLSAMEHGDPHASNQLLPLVYDELRKLAAAQLRQERGGQTLQATALVHEAYLRLVGTEREPPQWDNRRHFFVAAAESMRRILVENARRKRRVKHGGEFQRRDFADVAEISTGIQEDLVALDEALTKLEAINPPAAQVVQLRYFTGMSVPEVAAAMELSERTAARLWTYARAWLFREIGQERSEQETL